MKIFRTVSDNEFVWWKVFGWLGLFFDFLALIRTMINSEYLPENAKLFIYFLILLNFILMFLILEFNKWAFLIATILSFNPLLWIINGIYLKNRWCHPKVNKGKPCGKYAEEEVLNKFKESMK